MSLSKVIAFNGSGRRNGTTATLLKSFLKGAETQGAQTELVNLCDLRFTGCQFCFGCKKKTSRKRTCNLRDDLTQYLDHVADYKAMCFGSPITWFSESGMMKSFLERMLYQFMSYRNDNPTRFTGNTKIGYITTMGMNDAELNGLIKNANAQFAPFWTEKCFKMIFGNCDALFAKDCRQVKDFSKYDMSNQDVKRKDIADRTTWPEYIQKAFEMGVRLAKTN